MYVPPAFSEENLGKLHDFVEHNSFGLLVSQLEGRPFASHIPFLLERNAGPQGTLIGHIARANPQWHELERGEILAVFSGPHAYISPRWYAAQNVVPTWNYLAVHAYGRAVLIHDPEALAPLVDDFVRFYEQSLPEPWSIDARSEFILRMCKQVVGFRIEITRLEGKWKLGQNHPVERRQRAAQALRLRPDENSQAIAAGMEGTFAGPVANPADE